MVPNNYFIKYDNEVLELESDNANKTSTMGSFFATSNQVFMQQLQEKIANELFQVLNQLCGFVGFIIVKYAIYFLDIDTKYNVFGYLKICN